MTTQPSDPTPPLVLVFAASDPTGGAGIQADIMTMSGMGCHALTVITALTVQDTVGVEDVLPVDAGFVAEQARAVLEDMPVQAFKLGVLGSVASDVTHARPWGVSVVFGAIIFASYVAYWGRQHGPRGIVATSSETPPETYAPS